jgi:hypothetical protein
MCTDRVSTVIFHTTNAPMPVLLLLTTIWSSICTPFAQQASFLSEFPLVLSWRVIAPGTTDSTEMFETERECDCTQYGGLATTGELSLAGEFCCGGPDFLFKSSVLLSLHIAAPFMLPLLWCWSSVDSIH